MKFRKSFLVCALAVAGLGCGKKAEPANPGAPEASTADMLEELQQRQQADVRKLDARIASLEGDLEGLRSQIEARRREKAKLAKVAADSTVAQNAPPVVEEKQVPQEMTAEEKLAAYEAGGIQGVPPQISTQIINAAKAERGSAWETVVKIEKEATGYLLYDSFSRATTTMPQSVRDAMATAARRDSPNSWSQTGDKIRDETDAWNTVEAWKADVVPGLTRQQSLELISAVVAEHPHDWSRVVFDIGRKAKRLTR
jgi:hypothetical protein